MATITSPRATSPAPTHRMNSPSVPSITSPVSTPTSSVRPSLDVPRADAPPTNTTQTQNQNPNQRRNRAALRDYYNLKARPTSQLARTGSTASNDSSATATSTVTNKPDANNSDTSPFLTRLDEPNFEASAFITSLLAQAPLRDILRTEAALVSEIRTLDGERKALVYDNYSKLIKAVGTIAEMQKGMRRGANPDGGGLDGVEALQEKMSGLEAVVRELGPQEEVGRDAAAAATAAGDEDRKRRVRKGQQEVVRWVLSAPERLEGMEREEAEMEWARVKELLDRWTGTKGVDDVRRACQEVMRSKIAPPDDGSEGSDDDT